VEEIMKRRNLLEEFGEKHNLELVTQKAGFGITVTGFIPKDHFIFVSMDEQIARNKPKNAYPHCDIFAIVGGGLRAKGELIKWIKSLDTSNLHVSIVNNNNTGRQALETGTKTYVLTNK
jgi:hypothetical protein